MEATGAHADYNRHVILHSKMWSRHIEVSD